MTTLPTISRPAETAILALAELGRQFTRAAAVCLLATCLIAAKPAPRWVEFTRPMLACADGEDSVGLRDKLLASVQAWKVAGTVPAGCEQRGIGTKVMLDDQQSDVDTHIVVKSWDPVCTSGCTPFMTPVYSPSRQEVGAYLKQTTPPPGW